MLFMVLRIFSGMGGGLDIMLRMSGTQNFFRGGGGEFSIVLINLVVALISPSSGVRSSTGMGGG